MKTVIVPKPVYLRVSIPHEKTHDKENNYDGGFWKTKAIQKARILA
jgi:hypothetical protein